MSRGPKAYGKNGYRKMARLLLGILDRGTGMEREELLALELEHIVQYAVSSTLKDLKKRIEVYENDDPSLCMVPEEVQRDASASRGARGDVQRQMPNRVLAFEGALSRRGERVPRGRRRRA